MLAAGTAAEVLVGDEDAGVGESGVGEGMRFALGGEALDVIGKGVLANAVEGDAFQKPRGDDAVRVDVIPADHAGVALYEFDLPLGHQSFSRTSTTFPSSAAAATMAGDIKRVRPVGDPWRPLKLRLLEEAQISRPFNLSGFIARHMEQPGSRHSKPAARKVSSSPSVSACSATAWEG